MRSFFILLALLLPVSISHGQIKKVTFQIATNDDIFYTVYLKEKERGAIDSVITKDSGEFVLPASDFPFYNISVKDKPRAFKSFIAEKEDLPIKIRMDSSFRENRIFIDAGFRTNAFYAGTHTYELARANYVGELEAAPKHNWEVDEISQKRQAGLMGIFEYYLKHDPIVGLAILYQERYLLRNPRFSDENIEQLKALIDPLCAGNLKNHPAIKEVYAILNSFVQVSPGADVLDFEMPLLVKDSIGTKNYRGTYLLIDFWATWCGPCIKKNEEMRKAYNRLKVQNIDILGVLMDFNTLEYNNKYLLEHLDEKYQYPWKSGVLFRNDLNDRVIKFYQAYELPATVLISPLGTIIATGLSSVAEIEEAVNNYQKEIDNVPLKSIGDRNKGR